MKNPSIYSVNQSDSAFLRARWSRNFVLYSPDPAPLSYRGPCRGTGIESGIKIENTHGSYTIEAQLQVV